jgi:hypothetical protein
MAREKAIVELIFDLSSATSYIALATLLRLVRLLASYIIF